MSVQGWSDSLHNRRSTYTLSRESTIPDSEIKAILATALQQVPSSFGTYTTRMVLVVKDEHTRLWNLIIEIVKAVTPAEKWETQTKARLEGFLNSYGTVLFLEDPENTRKMQEAMPNYKEHLNNWARETNAMHQFAVWLALTNAGLGANLQHYNPLIDERVKEAFNIPAGWTLVSEMTFGKPTQAPKPKKLDMMKPVEERLLVWGADA